MNRKGPIRAKEGIVNLYKHKNALNYRAIDILVDPCMRSAIKNNFIILYSKASSKAFCRASASLPILYIG